jgi:phosphoglycolate phosphatase
VKLILWDIDGTLLLAYGAGKRAMERTGRAVVGERFDMSATEFAGRLDPLIVADAVTQSGYEVDEALQTRFRDRYIDELHKELHDAETRCELLPGVAPLLEQLFADKQLVHGLVTGNYGAAAHHKLRRVGLEPERFAVTGFGGEAPTRPDLVELALRRFAEHHDETPEETFVIGDTPHDVDCALAHGCVPVGVATGRFSVDELRGHGAELVFHDLREVQPLIDRLAAPRS